MILFVAGFLRLYLLGKYPTSLSVDEVSIGYNAYSILSTGRDQYRRFFPLVFESLGDFKSPVYIYVTAVSEKLLGVNEVAVRVPAAAAGIVVVFLAYLVIYRLTGKVNLALCSAAVLALSPWHIRFSRGAYEASLALAFLMSAFYCLIRLKKFTLGLVMAIFSMYTYHAEKIIAPLFVMGMVVIYRDRFHVLWNGSRKRMVFLGFVFALATMVAVFINGGQVRALHTSILSDVGVNQGLSQTKGLKSVNRAFLVFSTITNRYIQYFGSYYFYVKGGNYLLGDILDFGTQYLWELPLFSFGLWTLLRRSPSLFDDKQATQSFYLWTALSPIAASITLNDYHQIRSLMLVFSYILVVGVGIRELVIKTGSRLIEVLVVLTYLWGLSAFINYYTVHWPMQKSDQSFEPFKSIARIVLEKGGAFDGVVIDPAFGKEAPDIIGAPELYVLFYGKIDPRIYWSNLGPGRIGKIQIRHIDWNIDKYLPNTLFVGSPWSLPMKVIEPQNVLNKIYFANNTLAYLVVKSRWWW